MAALSRLTRSALLFPRTFALNPVLADERRHLVGRMTTIDPSRARRPTEMAMPPHGSAPYAGPMEMTTGRVAMAVGKGLVYGALTLIDPRELTGARKQAYWLGLSGLGAAEMLLGPDIDDGQDAVPGAKAGGALAVAGVIYGARGVWERLDAWTVRGVSRMGATHPRWWLAAASAGMVIALTLAEDGPHEPDEDDVDLTPDATSERRDTAPPA